jgi:hypothetical protein
MKILKVFMDWREALIGLGLATIFFGACGWIVADVRQKYSLKAAAINAEVVSTNYELPIDSLRKLIHLPK